MNKIDCFYFWFLTVISAYVSLKVMYIMYPQIVLLFIFVFHLFIFILTNKQVIF